MVLILEDGKVFQGKAFGAIKSCIFEVVFNTAMAGYTESISDPSFGRTRWLWLSLRWAIMASV